MGMPNQQEDAPGRRWSVEDVLALPNDGNRYETVDGELLVSPSLRYLHQAVVGAVYAALRAWVAAEGIGVVLFAPADVILDAHTLVQPDVFLLPPVGADVMSGAVPGPAPLLVVEVLSPGNARHDRLRKRPRYQRAGIECWLVDAESQLVERWATDSARPEVCMDQIAWYPDRASSPFTMELAPVWKEVGLPTVG